MNINRSMIVGLIQLHTHPVEQVDQSVKGYLFPLKVKIIEPSLQRGRNVVRALHYGSTVMMLTMGCEDRDTAGMPYSLYSKVL